MGVCVCINHGMCVSVSAKEEEEEVVRRGGVVLVAATSARVLLRRAPAGMVEKQLVHASATPTSPELGPRGSSLHDKRQLTLLCLSLT